MKGRDKEAEDIVLYERAVEVANLMLGKVNRPIRRLFAEDYRGLPRRNLKAGSEDIKRKWGDVKEFCRENFEKTPPEKLAALYERLLQHCGSYRLPLVEFINRVGRPREEVLKGAPLHSTVHVSQWGLQFEFPEMHMARDVAIAYNAVLRLKQDIDRIQARKPSWSDVKREQDSIARKQSELKYHMRMCLICCFNLVEAYINGLAWVYMNTAADKSTLSENQRRLLEGDQTSILDKLLKIPKLVKGVDSGPLSKDESPLSEFRDIIKPHRDSVVHASPYSAPERFGGYDKLSKVYDLEPDVVRRSVELSIGIVGVIHRFLEGKGEYPEWMPTRNSEGCFNL